MKKKSVSQHLLIDYYSATPKYLQLANSSIKAIGDGKIKKDELLPSINELSFEFEISRDTAEKGYKYLKKIGVLGSVLSKGYFVQDSNIKQQLKIFQFKYINLYAEIFIKIESIYSNVSKYYEAAIKIIKNFTVTCTYPTDSIRTNKPPWRNRCIKISSPNPYAQG